MLPTTDDIGERLAAVLPGALNLINERATSGVRSVIAVVVDGLGWNNLQDRRGHARTIASMSGKAVRTVVPSTTGAALSTITTGALPGVHGLVGYRILHPDAGLVTTLSEWDDIEHVRDWQRVETVFERAARTGVNSYAIGRGAHRSGGLTSAILTGADYVPAESIDERIEAAAALAAQKAPSLIYCYVDDIDRSGHKDGWNSASWIDHLEQLDQAVSMLLRSLPSDVGVILTADHGMVDVPASQHVLFDENPQMLEGVKLVGGEPRLRYLYLDDPDRSREVASRLRETEHGRAWVFTREEAISSGMYGPVHQSVIPRLGDVVLAAREAVAYYHGESDAGARGMIGQHGSFTDRERQVPLLTAGALNAIS